MESCISPDFDNLSSGSFGVLTEQRKQYHGKKYYRYRILSPRNSSLYRFFYKLVEMVR
jgi:hypothetical protein